MKDAGINPRSKEAYKRGSGMGYGTDRGESAAANIKKKVAAEKAEKAGEKASNMATATEVTSLKSQVKTLEAQVT